MTRPRILVTGATGRIGGAVVRALLHDGATVCAAVRRDDRRSDDLRRAGAEVVTVDLFDPTSIREAMAGVRRAAFVPPWHPAMVDTAAAFGAAAEDAGLESIVWLSQWLAGPDHPSPATRQHWLIDHLLRGVRGPATTIVNPGYFADNHLRVLDMAAHLGLFPSPTGESRNAPPSNDDIGRVMAAVLRDPSRHDGATYRPTGPALLSAADMAAVIGEVLGRPVRHWDLSERMFLKATQVYGVSPLEQLNVVHYLAEHRRGTFEHGAPTDHVAVVTGRPAETFATTVATEVARTGLRRTAGRRMAMLMRSMRIAATAPPDLDRIARRLMIDMPTEVRLSIDSPVWRAGHPAVALAPTGAPEVTS